MKARMRRQVGCLPPEAGSNWGVIHSEVFGSWAKRNCAAAVVLALVVALAERDGLLQADEPAGTAVTAV